MLCPNLLMAQSKGKVPLTQGVRAVEVQKSEYKNLLSKVTREYKKRKQIL